MGKRSALQIHFRNEEMENVLKKKDATLQNYCKTVKRMSCWNKFIRQASKRTSILSQSNGPYICIFLNQQSKLIKFKNNYLFCIHNNALHEMTTKYQLTSLSAENCAVEMYSKMQELCFIFFN